MSEPRCPECGELLSYIRLIDRNKRRLGLQITCEWCDYDGISIDLGINKEMLRKYHGHEGLFKATLQQVDSID
ncbi:MAG: hypothetical protein L6N96_01855 [Candidatus Methylarchaceae archaeon HK02M2]|nr:hypothetical protein [Candidatus Methylarchaceae archaeon HK02M2]